MDIQPIAHFRSPFKSKFGIPRQSGVVAEVTGKIVFTPPYRNPDAVRGIEDFSHLWLIWEFSANRHGASSLLVRPPRLGGNKSVGVFASRSPFRPNPLGLSCVELKEVTYDDDNSPVLIVAGADLMDGTPIYDIKPYLSYVDAKDNARCGYVDNVSWEPLEVSFPEHLKTGIAPEDIRIIIETLRQNPRPHYHKDPDRIYGMPYEDMDVRFRIEDGTAIITEIVKR